MQNLVCREYSKCIHSQTHTCVCACTHARTHAPTHTHTHRSTCTYKHTGYTKLNLYKLELEANRDLRQMKTAYNILHLLCVLLLLVSTPISITILKMFLSLFSMIFFIVQRYAFLAGLVREEAAILSLHWSWSFIRCNASGSSCAFHHDKVSRAIVLVWTPTLLQYSVPA